MIPLGVAAGIPYVVVVLTAWWMADRRAIFVLAGLSTLFVIIGYFFSEDAGITWMVLANRGMAIFAIWTTATLLLMVERTRQIQEELLQKRTHELRESEEWLNESQEIAHLGAWDIDYDTGDYYWSDEVYRIFGVDKKSFRPSVKSFHACIHPDDIEVVQSLWQESNKHGERYDFEHRIVLPNGDVRLVHEHSRPYLDEAGNVYRERGTVQDITERKQIEEQLRQAQKMEVVGQLTGGVAHDFNNLLTVVLGSLEFVRDEQDQAGTNRKMIDLGINAAERGAALTHRLLAFSRKQTLMPTAIDLNTLVAGMTDMLRCTLGERIEIRSRSSNGLWNCQADQSQLENALLNLTINARDTMPDGGALTIETANVTLSDENSALQADVEPGYYVMLGVSDTGSGIAADTLEHVFEPFFTTKDVGKGSGLGLSMVYGFAKQSGGNATIYSELGEGTTVKVYLPRSAAKDDAAEANDGAENIPLAHGERILIVEDNPNVRALAVALLTELRYEIVEACSAQAALEVMAHAAKIDLLLSDVVLPGDMNGPELAAEIQRRNPAIKIIFMTGYAEDAFNNRDESNEQMNVIQKPFGKAGLAKKIRRVLDS